MPPVIKQQRNIAIGFFQTIRRIKLDGCDIEVNDHGDLLDEPGRDDKSTNTILQELPAAYSSTLGQDKI